MDPLTQWIAKKALHERARVLHHRGFNAWVEQDSDGVYVLMVRWRNRKKPFLVR